MPEVGLKEIERRLLVFLGSLDFEITNARRCLEINQGYIGLPPYEHQNDDLVLTLATSELRVLKGLRGKLLEFFPILLTSGQESDGAQSSTKEE